MKIRVVVADDHKVMRQGLCSLLNASDDIEVVGEADEGRAAVHLVQQLSPDLIIMDIGMPNLNGIEATKRIKSVAPNVKVLPLSMHDDVQFVIEVLRSGASGYLLKDSTSEELFQAIHSIIKGQLYLSPNILGTIVEDYLLKAPSSKQVLTDREREIIQLLAEGKTTREIASALRLSTKTVDTHRMRIMNKLNLHTIADLTKYAVRKGISL